MSNNKTLMCNKEGTELKDVAVGSSGFCHKIKTYASIGWFLWEVPYGWQVTFSNCGNRAKCLLTFTGKKAKGKKVEDYEDSFATGESHFEALKRALVPLLGDKKAWAKREEFRQGEIRRAKQQERNDWFNDPDNDYTKDLS